MRLQGALVVAQIGLSLMLLCGAGLLRNSLLRLAAIDVGCSKQNVVAASVALPGRRLDPNANRAELLKFLMEENGRAALFHRRLMEDARGMPGVLDVSACDYLPMRPAHFGYRLSAAGAAAPFAACLMKYVELRIG